MHKVLKFSSSAMSPCIQNVLDFILFFTINDRRWSCKRCAILLHLLIRKKKIHVKHIVNFYQLGKVESHGYGTDFL